MSTINCSAYQPLSDNCTDKATQADSDAEQEPQKLLGPWSTGLSIFKGFVGTGILYGPTSFVSGGSAFSAVALILSLVLTLYCIGLLLEVRSALGGHLSYSEMGVAALGSKGRTLCDVVIFMSQVGFVIAFIYFIASQTLRLLDSSRGEWGLAPLDEKYKWAFLPIIFLIIMPMLMVHKPQKFARAHIFADVVILFTVAAILYFVVQSIQSNGWMATDLPLINRDKWANVIGFAVYSFEGVGVILPIQDMTANKQDYFRVVCITVTVIAAAYVIFSELCLYAWYDRFSADAPLIIEYLPRDSLFCWVLILIFNVNMVISYVLVIYPASKVLDRLFLSEIETGPKKRVYKNLLRACLLIATIVIALTVWNKLNTFLAIAGSLAMTPVAFILPPMFHYIVCAETGRQKLIDVALIWFGLIVMVFCTSFAILTW